MPKKRKKGVFKPQDNFIETTDMTQMAFNVAITKEALDFQANMSAAIINSSIQQSSEMMQTLRAAGMAAEGIGANLNIAV